MVKRLTIALILFSMVLHCASRLGIVSYLYQQRHDIAYTLGMIAEVPIAMCNSDYDFGQGLVIHEHNDHESTIPPAIFHAQEIQLFFISGIDLDVRENWLVVKSPKPLFLADNKYASPALSIFHPPS